MSIPVMSSEERVRHAMTWLIACDPGTPKHIAAVKELVNATNEFAMQESEDTFGTALTRKQ